MDRNNKISLLVQLSIIPLAIALVVCLSIGIARGRYSTQFGQSVQYYADEPPTVYVNNVLSQGTVRLLPDNWQTTEEKLECSFLLSNVDLSLDQPEERDLKLRVRLFIPELPAEAVAAAEAESVPAEGETSSAEQAPEEPLREDELSFTLTLGNGGKTYQSQVAVLQEGTPFYQEGADGWYYCFYEVVNGQPTSEEAAYLLEGGKSSMLTFTLTGTNPALDPSRIQVFIDQAK